LFGSDFNVYSDSAVKDIHLHRPVLKAGDLPHNIKVFNLCLINKMGLEKWAESKAGDARQTYFTKPWTLAQMTTGG